MEEKKENKNYQFTSMRNLYYKNNENNNVTREDNKIKVNQPSNYLCIRKEKKMKNKQTHHTHM